MNLYEMQKIINWAKASLVSYSCDEVRNVVDVTSAIIDELTGGFYCTELEDYHHLVYGEVQIRALAQIEVFSIVDRLYEYQVSPQQGLDEYVGICSNDGEVLEDNTQDHTMAPAIQVLSLLDCLNVSYVLDTGELCIIDDTDADVKIALLYALIGLQKHIDVHGDMSGFVLANNNLRKVLEVTSRDTHRMLSLRAL